MKIICIQTKIDTSSIEKTIKEGYYFFKPDTCLLLNNRPFYIPDFSENITYSLDIVIKINRLGKNISKRFAHRYYNELSLGISFIAKDLLEHLSSNNMPWDIATCFDYSSAIGTFKNIDSIENVQKIDISNSVNNKEIGITSILNIKEVIDIVIADISKYSTLKIGDYLYLEVITPDQTISIGDEIKGMINGVPIISVNVK